MLRHRWWEVTEEAVIKIQSAYRRHLAILHVEGLWAARHRKLEEADATAEALAMVEWKERDALAQQRAADVRRIHAAEIAREVCDIRPNGAAKLLTLTPTLPPKASSQIFRWGSGTESLVLVAGRDARWTTRRRKRACVSWRLEKGWLEMGEGQTCIRTAVHRRRRGGTPPWTPLPPPPRPPSPPPPPLLMCD